MAYNDKTTVFVSGKMYWSKVLGKPVDNYEKTGKEWTFEFEPDDTSFLKEAKLLDRLKERDGRGPSIMIRKKEFNAEGEKNDHFRIYNQDGEPWNHETLIGNGTEADIKLNVIDWGKGKKKSIYAQAIRITKLVPYVSNEFGAMDASKPKTVKEKREKVYADLDGLDDDIPFD